LATSRASVVSSFTIIKGSLIDETYAAFQQWDLDRPKATNLERIRANGALASASSNWDRDVAKVLNRRFDPTGRDRALAELAKAGCDREVWKPILLWHMTRDEFLLRDFLVGWLYDRYVDGTYRIRTDDVVPYLQGL
jgi:BrxA